MARMVITTLRSPRRSAKSNIKTAALLLTGKRFHTGNGGALYDLSRAIAAFHPFPVRQPLLHVLGFLNGVPTMEAGDRGAILLASKY
jgi:hypothetical protein